MVADPDLERYERFASRGLAGEGPINDGVPELIEDASDRAADITKRMRKAAL